MGILDNIKAKKWLKDHITDSPSEFILCLQSSPNYVKNNSQFMNNEIANYIFSSESCSDQLISSIVNGSLSLENILRSVKPERIPQSFNAKLKSNLEKSF